MNREKVFNSHTLIKLNRVKSVKVVSKIYEALAPFRFNGKMSILGQLLPLS